MLDVVLPPSASSKPVCAAAVAAGNDASHPLPTAPSPSGPSSSPMVVEVPQEMPARSTGNFASAFTVSSFDSALPLALPDSSVSGVQTSARNRFSFMTLGSTRHSSPLNHNLSLGGSGSMSADRRNLYNTPPPLVRSMAVAGTARQQPPPQQQQALSSMTPNTAVPLALASLPDVSASSASSPRERRGRGPVLPISPDSPPLFVDTASVLIPLAVLATAAADGTRVSSSKASSCPSPTPQTIPATAASPTTESTWVTYDAYLSLSAPVLPQRALQDRVAQLCCSAMTVAGPQEKPLICLDDVFFFLLYGRAVYPPVHPALPNVSALPDNKSHSSHNDAAQRMCFPLFCLAGAKLCSLSDQTRAVRSIHTPSPPMRVAMAMDPQRDDSNQQQQEQQEQQRSGRLCILLLFTEQLLDAFPDFPPELLETTSPSGVVTSPTAEHRSWHSTPREVRKTSSYDGLWSVVTLARFAVLLQRWGVSPAAAFQRLRAVRKMTAVEAVAAAAPQPATPHQLMTLPATKASSHSLVHALRVEEGGVAAPPIPPQREVSAETLNSTPPSARPHVPYPPSTRNAQPRQHQHQHPSSESNSVCTDTIVSGGSWDYTALHAAASALAHVEGTPATSAATVVRIPTGAAVRGGRARTDATLTVSSTGTPFLFDSAERVDEVPVDVGCDVGGHPYNASVAADPTSMTMLNSSGGARDAATSRRAHRYDVPSPPRVSPTAMATSHSDRGTAFLRTFARGGGVIPSTAGSFASEAWCAAKGKPTFITANAAAYVPSPPKAQQWQHVQSRSPPIPASCSADLGSRRFSDVVPPRQSRPVTAEEPRRTVLRGATRPPTSHPYNVAAAAASTSRRHKKAHRHRRRSDGSSGAAVAVPDKSAIAEEGSTAAAQRPAASSVTKVHADDPASPSTASNANPPRRGDRHGSSSSAWSAEKRTEQVNAYVQQLITASTATAVNKQSEATAVVDGEARQSHRCIDPTGHLHSGSSISDANGLVVAVGCDPHTCSGRSNASANINSVNGGAAVKDAFGTHSSLASPETNSSASQRISTGVQHVPAPPPPPPLSQSRRSNPRTSILQSWESSMLSTSDSGWPAAAENASPAARQPSSWSPAEPGEDVVVQPSFSDGAAVAASALLGSSAVIPSAASSPSQLSDLHPPRTVPEERTKPTTASHAPTAAAAAAEGEAVPLAPPFLRASHHPTSVPHVLNGVGASDKGLWLVSHLPEHGFIVTSLQLASSAAATTGPAAAPAALASVDTPPAAVPRSEEVDSTTVPSDMAAEPHRAARESPQLPADKSPSPSADVVVTVPADETREGRGDAAPAPSAVAAAVDCMQPGAAVSMTLDPAQLVVEEALEPHATTTPTASVSPLPLQPQHPSASAPPSSPSPVAAARQTEAQPTPTVSILSSKKPPHTVAPPPPPPRLGFAAQLRALAAPVMQAVGRGYLARRRLAAAAAVVPTSTPQQVEVKMVSSMPLPTTAASPFAQASLVLTAAAEKDLATAAALQPHPPAVNTAASPAVTAEHALDTKPPRVVRPPPLTAFAVPDAPAGLPSPVMHELLRPAGASANASAGEVRTNESSCLNAARSCSLKELQSAHERGLTRSSSSQSSGASSQHRSSMSPTQRLFAIYGVPSSSAMENSSSSWMPPAPAHGASHATASCNESGVLDNRPHRVARVVEQSLDTSRVSSLSAPWARDGGIGPRSTRDAMASTHTLPPPKEESRAAGSGDRSSRGGEEDEGREEDSDTVAVPHAKRRENAHLATSVIVPKLGGDVDATVPPSLMKPIAIPPHDRLSEEVTSSILRDSTEDWLNLLHSRLGGASSCTIAFLGQTANGPANGSVRSATTTNVTAAFQQRSDMKGRRGSGSFDSTWAMNSAICMLRLQRVGRGYLARTQLAQRFREAEEETNLDALLKDVLWQPAPEMAAMFSSSSISASAAAITTPDGASSDRMLVATHSLALMPQLPSSPARSSSSPSAALLGPPLTPFQVPAEGFVPSTQSSGSVYAADGVNDHLSPTTSSGSASRFTGDAGASTAAGSEAHSRAGKKKSPFVTPDNARYPMSPAFLPPSTHSAAHRSSFSQEFAPSSSLSLSREAAGATGMMGGGGLVMAGPAFADASASSSGAAGGGPGEPPSLPPSASRRCGVVSPPSLRVSFSRDTYSPLLRQEEAEAAAQTASGGLFVSLAAAAVSPVGCEARPKLGEGASGLVLARRSSPPAHSEASPAATAAAAAAEAAPIIPLPSSVAATLDAVMNVKSFLGEFVEELEEEEASFVTPANPIPAWKASSAAAGANTTPLEGSIFATSGRSSRSMMSAGSLPFEFSTTAHAVSAMSHGELMFSGRTMGSITPAQWALNGVAMVDSSHFDDGESMSEDNNELRGGSSDSDEEGEEGNNSSDDDADEADAFCKDITHVEGAEPACFGAAAHLLRGDKAALTKDHALALLQRVGRGYLCRRHEHFLFMVSISFSEVALLQRVAVGFLTRKRMGLEFHVNRLVHEEMARWEVRNRAAIKLHAVVRGFIARQRVKRLQRKLFTRLELRTALELPDPEE